MTGFSFGAWEFPGDTLLAVDWSITSGENGGTVYGSGTATSMGSGPGGTLSDKFTSSNQFGYNIDTGTVSGIGVGLGGPASPGVSTYWLNLANAVVASGDPVFWDENSGIGCGSPGCPSSASESAVGSIPSEAFTVQISGGGGGTTPEPSSILLLGSGIVGLAGVLRYKLF